MPQNLVPPMIAVAVAPWIVVLIEVIEFFGWGSLQGVSVTRAGLSLGIRRVPTHPKSRVVQRITQH